MHLQVIVPRLNKRNLIPLSLPDRANIAGEVLMGFTFEGVEVPVVEMPNPAMGKWYKDRDGHFYWGGGVMIIEEISTVPILELAPEEFETVEIIRFDPLRMSWGHEFYDIPFIWNDLKTKGTGVTVAVIDTGVDINHLDLKTNVLQLSKSFVGNESDIADTAGHGTNMAGIIAANGSGKVYGVAPEAKLVIIKATTQSNGVDLKTFAKAINYAASIPEVDIVSISFSFLTDDPDIKAAIQKCLDARKIVAAAIGNRRNATKPFDDNTFPSSYNNGFPNHEGVLGIGAFDKSGNLCSFSNWNNHLSFLSPGDFSVLTTGLNNSATNGSLTSIATAFTCGCLALMVSYTKANPTVPSANCVRALLDTCDDIGPILGFDVRSGYGRMNLRNAIAKIKFI